MNFYTKKIRFSFFALFSVFLFCGCGFSADLSEKSVKEEIFVALPAWPPSGVFRDKYPELSRWEIDVYSCEKKERFYASGEGFSFTANKNEPFCVTAKPVTRATTCVSDEKTCHYETSFFYPAGAIYPYSKNEERSLFLTWENGFTAECMKRIIKSGNETNVSAEVLRQFVESFNWKKASKEIEKRISDSVANDDEAIYNPWLLDSQKILEKLSERKFSASYLNLSGYDDFDLSENLDFENNCANDDAILFSKFVIENEYLYEKKKIKLKNGVNNYLSDCRKFEIIISVNSGKKLSKETVLLPIYFERL